MVKEPLCTVLVSALHVLHSLPQQACACVCGSCLPSVLHAKLTIVHHGQRRMRASVQASAPRGISRFLVGALRCTWLNGGCPSAHPDSDGQLSALQHHALIALISQLGRLSLGSKHVSRFMPPAYFGM
jgi:hypothetical protein